MMEWHLHLALPVTLNFFQGPFFAQSAGSGRHDGC